MRTCAVRQRADSGASSTHKLICPSYLFIKVQALRISYIYSKMSIYTLSTCILTTTVLRKTFGLTLNYCRVHHSICFLELHLHVSLCSIASVLVFNFTNNRGMRLAPSAVLLHPCRPVRAGIGWRQSCSDGPLIS